MIERIQARIDELEREQAQFITDCNLQLARYGAAIGELKKLLESEAAA